MLEGKVEGQRNRGRPKRPWEKDVEDWIGVSVWRVGRTEEDWLMYSRSVVECRTRNRESPGSNPLCYRFEDLAFFVPFTVAPVDSAV